MKSGMTLFKVLFMLILVTFANFPPHSLTLLEVTVTGDQMKRTVILNKERFDVKLHDKKNVLLKMRGSGCDTYGGV